MKNSTTVLVKPYTRGLAGIWVADPLALTRSDNARFNFKVKVDNEVFHIARICDKGLMHGNPAQDGTANADHEAGAIVRRI